MLYHSFFHYNYCSNFPISKLLMEKIIKIYVNPIHLYLREDKASICCTDCFSSQGLQILNNAAMNLKCDKFLKLKVTFPLSVTFLFLVRSFINASYAFRFSLNCKSKLATYFRHLILSRWLIVLSVRVRYPIPVVHAIYRNRRRKEVQGSQESIQKNNFWHLRSYWFVRLINSHGPFQLFS